MSGGAVLITGANRGIGRAIAGRMAAEGRRVINLDIAAPDEPLAGERHIAVDLTDAAATNEALAEAAAGNEITGLVNNAGIAIAARIEETRIEDFERTLAINLRAAMQCTQAVVASMKKAGRGRIVSISSRAARGKEMRTAYAATKVGLIGMTRVWALELAAFAITANAVAPGPTETELFHAANPPDSPRTKAIVASIPAGRLASPDDIAHAAAFFLDERSGFVTGQVLYVCGGASIGTAPT